MPGLDARYFAGPAEFREWLAAHHGTTAELWVGFYKKATGRPSMTWPESVGEALCYGWIDGIRKSIDVERYVIRFTPRKRGSMWSAVNIRRMHELIAEGRAQLSGVAAFERRDEQKTQRYSFEQAGLALDPQYEREFRRHPRAWKFFQSHPPSARRAATWWVMSAKREDTRVRRLQSLIADCAAGQRVGSMQPARNKPSE